MRRAIFKRHFLVKKGKRLFAQKNAFSIPMNKHARKKLPSFSDLHLAASSKMQAACSMHLDAAGDFLRAFPGQKKRGFVRTKKPSVFPRIKHARRKCVDHAKSGPFFSVLQLAA
jgi:hypothetical protein